MSDAQFGIAIVGENKVEKGAKAAEKRLGKIPQHAGVAGKKYVAEAERSVGGMSKGILRTLTGVEQAGAKVFGGRSLTSGLTSRLGALGQAGSTAGTGLGEATASAGLFEGAIGAVGVAVAGTVGIVMAAGYAAFKLADGWAKGAASIGRTADIIGVGTKALQEFGAAAERAGVDKDKAIGGLGGLSENLNDARYGRNPAAMAVLGRLGVAMKKNADGTVDVGAMLPQIADAIARQNSSGRRTAARSLGIPLDTLPVFTQGGKQLASDMKDADDHAVVLSGDQVATGRRLQRKGAMVGQLKDQAMNAVGRTAAETAEPGYDAVLKGGTALSDAAGGKSGPAKVERGGAAVERGGAAIERAAYSMQAASGGAGRLSAGQVTAKARQGIRLVPKLMALGVNRPDAEAMAANAVMESGAIAHQAEKGGGHGFGLFQITDRTRRARFRQVIGKNVEQSTEDEQLRYQVWELGHSEASGWRHAHANGADASNVAAGYARWVERPANKPRDSAERYAVAGVMAGATPVHVTVELKNAPPGTRATARAGHGSMPAISHAVQPQSHTPAMR